MAIPAPIYPTQLTVRLQIMHEVRQRLAMVTLENGFATDIGTNLFYGQQTTPEPHVFPITYYWDHFESPAPQLGSQHNAVQVQIESFERLPITDEQLESYTETEMAELIAQQMPIVCNLHLADLKRALSHDWQTGHYDTKLNGLAHSLAYLESDPFFGVQPAQLLWGGLNSQWVITYQHAPGDPYTLKRA